MRRSLLSQGVRICPADLSRGRFVQEAISKLLIEFAPFQTWHDLKNVFLRHFTILTQYGERFTLPNPFWRPPLSGSAA
jgi:hypothetical protein